jgi:hypothetical protein
MRTRIVLFTALAAVSTAAEARADVKGQVVAGVTGSLTEWRGDVGGLSSFKLGIKANDYFAIYLLSRLGLGAVDSRMLTLVSAGVQVWPFGDLGGVAPFARLSICHQHEETLSVVGNDPFGAIFGIGDGIRHRGGFEGALGLDIPFIANGDFEVFGSLEASTIWFYDPRGPNWYWNGGAGLGMNYAF